MSRKILCLCAALACAHGWAQDIPTLNEVVVTATRVDSSVLDSPSSINVISAQQIAESGATDVSQLITGQPGAVVNDYGPVGATKTVSLRGSTSSQVLVLLDGIRLNSSRDGGVDLSTIPMEIIDHIEIVRGGESALYGTGAIGGVINIITKKADKPSLSLSVSNGSYIPHAANTVSSSLATTPVDANPMDLLDSQSIDLSMEGKLGAVGLTAGGSFSRAANGFTWNDTAGINDWRRRTNADSLGGSGYAGVDAPLFGGLFSAKADFSSSATGTPGTLTGVSTQGTQNDINASGLVLWKTDRLFSDALTLDVKGFYRYDALAAADPAPPYSAPPYSDLHQTQSMGIDVTQKLTILDSVSAIYGASVYYDNVQSTRLFTMRDRLNLAGFLSLPVSPWEALTITPSVRYDYFSDFAGNFSYSLSAVLLLSPESSLRLSFASAYRAPTLNDMFWDDPFTPGNPDLKPETSYSGEIGWKVADKSFTLDVALFSRYVLDAITWAPTGDPLLDPWTPKNLGKSFEPGAEVHAKLLAFDHFSLEASYGFIYSFLLNDGVSDFSFSDNRRVIYTPMHSVSAQARYSGSPVEVGIELRYTSEEYTDTSNTEAYALPGYFLANADVRLAVGENMAFTLALKNIFNALYYTQSGYPMPPFSVVTGVSVKL